MTNFEWCKTAFDKGWTNAEKLKIWVSSGRITPEEFKTITEQEYIA